jgi:hypothetical protein
LGEHGRRKKPGFASIVTPSGEISFHACYRPRGWNFNQNRCWQVSDDYSSVNNHKNHVASNNIKPSSYYSMQAIAARAPSFCNAFNDSGTKFACQDACARGGGSSGLCNRWRYEILPKFQANGDAGADTGSVHASASKRSCPEGTRLWICDGSSYRCLSNPYPVGCSLAR